MATIGHTLTGLSAALIRNPPARKWPSMAWWPGFLILGAHLPDIAEWILAICGVQAERSHQFHTIRACTGCVLAGSLLLLVLARVRSVIPHLIWAATLFSHLLLDSTPLNHEIRRWYRDPLPGQVVQARGLDIPAEIWFYMFPLVVGLLIHVILKTRRDSATVPLARAPRRIRQAAILTIPLVAVALFLPDPRFVWIAIDALAITFSLWALGIRPRLLWFANLIPALPVVALGVFEFLAAMDTQRGTMLEARGDHARAATYFERATRWPTRTGSVIRLWSLGQSRERAGDLPGAERAFKDCVAGDVEWHWSKLILAEFYLGHKGTPFNKPSEGIRLLQSVAEGEEPEYYRNLARRWLEDLRRSMPPNADPLGS